ncbi:hypothetical protein H2198_002798 [Neophaeococcomyces mojaviensis]|uniref:Uncharacterized protein n=1 Tax=Neophaeococcomyces mojaviensis TaxID=3383035 RepID=A0ACC3ADE0_9EURO|nr:hypothetical protein H2198_002798 [Knufia sp. JES_112]
MRLSFTAITFGVLLATADALTFTSPAAGDSLDPTQPITVEWTSDSSDPSTFDLILDNSNKNSLVKNKKIATSISTSSGSYILSTAAIMTYGDGFIFKAQSASGNTLSTSGAFTLAVDTSAVVTSNGRVSYQSTYTATVPPSSTAQGALAVSSSAQTTSNSAITTDSLVAQTTATATTTEATESATSTPEATTTSESSRSSFMTSTTARSSSSSGSSSSSTRSASSSAASATTSVNAQPRVGSSGRIVFSAAGVIAGIVALLA